MSQDGLLSGARRSIDGGFKVVDANKQAIAYVLATPISAMPKLPSG
jgi:hypothetical protein